MEPSQIATVLFAAVLGLLVLWTYAVFIGGLDARGRAEAWAVLGASSQLFCVWCVSAGSACAGFLVFVVSFLLLDKDGGAHASMCFGLADVPVAFFLGFSALYAPLLYFGQRTLVMVVLVGAAASAGVLAYFAYELFGASHPAFGLTVVLAVHCLVMDVGVWGWSWWWRTAAEEEEALYI